MPVARRTPCLKNSGGIQRCARRLGEGKIGKRQQVDCPKIWDLAGGKIEGPKAHMSHVIWISELGLSSNIVALNHGLCDDSPHAYSQAVPTSERHVSISLFAWKMTVEHSVVILVDFAGNETRPSESFATQAITSADRSTACDVRRASSRGHQHVQATRLPSRARATAPRSSTSTSTTLHKCPPALSRGTLPAHTNARVADTLIERGWT